MKEGQPIRIKAARLVNEVVIQKQHPDGDHTKAMISLAQVVADNPEALDLIINHPK